MESLSAQVIRLGNPQGDTCLILLENTASLSQNQRRVGHIYISPNTSFKFNFIDQGLF